MTIQTAQNSLELTLLSLLKKGSALLYLLGGGAWSGSAGAVLIC
jgi:hypothetical protein